MLPLLSAAKPLPVIQIEPSDPLGVRFSTWFCFSVASL
jgi:hypothetical protein